MYDHVIWATDGYQQSPVTVLLGQPAVPRGGFEVTVWDMVNGRRVAGFSRKDRGYVVLSPGPTVNKDSLLASISQ